MPPSVRAADAELAELAASGEPIVAGPWTGDLGTELLYWLPFLRWFACRFGVTRDRLAAVSRPGAGSWYADVCGRHAPSPAGLSGRPLLPRLLAAVADGYRQEREPIVHLLERLDYARVGAPPAGRAPGALVLWPGEDSVPELGDDSGPVLEIEPDELADASALTAAVTGARLLAGPWDPGLLLGPMLGVPTLALTGAAPSPDLDLAQRAARILETPLLVVDRSQVGLAARLGRRAGA